MIIGSLRQGPFTWAVAVLLAAAGLSISGCGSGGPPVGETVGLAGSLETVRPDSAPSEAKTIEVVAGRGGFADFQIVLGGGENGITVGEVTVGAFTGEEGRIRADRATVYEERLVELPVASDVEGGAGPWPDPLVPVRDAFYGEQRNALPLEVEAEQTRALWVDVHVPAATRPGTYEGAITVAGPGLEHQLEATIVVADVEIEPEPEIVTAYGLRPAECEAHELDCEGDPEAAWRLRSLYVRAALDNHIGPINPALSTGSSQDTELFRRYILPLVQGSPIPGEGGALSEPRLVGARPQRIQVDEDLAWWQREAAAGEFSDRAFSYPCDEPDDDAMSWRECVRAAAAVGVRWPGLPTMVTASVEKASEAGALADFDILSTVVNQLEDRPGEEFAGDRRPAADDFIAAGGELWSYNSCLSHGCDETGGDYYRGWPSYVIDQPASEHRAMGPLAFRYGTSGELYYALNRDLGTAWSGESAFGGNGDGTLFYPGRVDLIGGEHEIPVESIRMKRIRDGLEDLALLTALAESGREPEALALAETLVPVTYETAVDPSAYESFRAETAELLGG